MTTFKKQNILTAIFAILIAVPFLASAQTESEFRFNRENWFTTPHPQVATFVVAADGSAYGTTTTAIPFRQINVPNDRGLRIQRFEIQDHYHYVVEGRIVYTLPEISAQLALATQ